MLSEHPSLKTRFKDARPLERPKGFGLPLGGKRRPVSGDRYLLTGDAAGFIDPFSGEGIGNAIRSGRFAGSHLIKGMQIKDFSATFNRQYDSHFYEKMMHEFKISHRIQYLSCYPLLFNFVVNRISKSPELQKFLTQAIADPELMKSFFNPGFYWRLLTKS